MIPIATIHGRWRARTSLLSALMLASSASWALKVSLTDHFHHSQSFIHENLFDISDGSGILSHERLHRSAVWQRLRRLPSASEDNLRPMCLELCRGFASEGGIKQISRKGAFVL